MHSDVCGPFEIKSLRGNFYFLTFIDEITRYMLAYLLEKKSEVFLNFKRFKMLVKL